MKHYYEITLSRRVNPIEFGFTSGYYNDSHHLQIPFGAKYPIKSGEKCRELILSVIPQFYDQFSQVLISKMNGYSGIVTYLHDNEVVFDNRTPRDVVDRIEDFFNDFKITQ